MSIDEVARETRISPRFLEALEAEAFDELPAPVYVRGFLRSYANYLRIEPQPLLDRLVGGDVSMPKAAGGYIGGNGTNLQNLPRRTDPFQRSGVVATPAPPKKPRLPVASPESDDVFDDESWAPEPLAPVTPPHQDHGYVPGSDLMEAPEYGHAEPYEYAEPEPIYTPRFDRRQAGVLAERPGGPSGPGSSGRLIALAGGVVAVLVFLALAVLLTRSDGDGNVPANAAGGDSTPGTTPGTVISLGTRTQSPSPSASVAPAGATTSVTASVTVSGTTTATPTTGAGTPTATPTTGISPTSAPTAAPTATPTNPPPTATPTRVPVVQPASLGLGECQPTGGSYDCGNGPFRVICYAPINQSLNKNWWVDINWDFGPIPTDQGWRETTVNGTVGDIITAGAAGCD